MSKFPGDFLGDFSGEGGEFCAARNPADNGHEPGPGASRPHVPPGVRPEMSVMHGRNTPAPLQEFADCKVY
jgi:hypothetical protein